MLHSTNIRMLQKHSEVATFEGSFKSNYIRLCTTIHYHFDKDIIFVVSHGATP